MVKTLKGFIYGLIFSLVISGTLVAAAPAVREVFFGVHVVFNGVPVAFDEDSQPFIINGRTFLPVRTIAEITGLEVDFFDGVVMLTSPGALSVQPRRFSPGIWRENIFVSEYLGLTFTKPNNWNITAEPQMYDMAVTSPLGASVRIKYERVTPNYIEDMIRESEQTGMTVTRNLSTTAIGGYHWNSFQTVMEIPDISLNVYGHYFISIESGIARVITIIRPDISESLEEILEMFGA
ncbi:MAG: copper amine oxidase N-terminal domain-containing protein [Defluviitaleaceae bacterium]|nr:copper amine oxidase N-terminal domain-containing protein [Defluviitaleaceae bacterium]